MPISLQMQSHGANVGDQPINVFVEPRSPGERIPGHILSYVQGGNPQTRPIKWKSQHQGRDECPMDAAPKKSSRPWRQAFPAACVRNAEALLAIPAKACFQLSALPPPRRRRSVIFPCDGRMRRQESERIQGFLHEIRGVSLPSPTRGNENPDIYHSVLVIHSRDACRGHDSATSSLSGVIICPGLPGTAVRGELLRPTVKIMIATGKVNRQMRIARTRKKGR